MLRPQISDQFMPFLNAFNKNMLAIISLPLCSLNQFQKQIPEIGPNPRSDA